MSYCECDVYDDCDPPAFVQVIRPHARKQYCCEECRGPILPGEVYLKIVGRWSDGVDTFRICSPCLELEEWAKISVPCFCSITGELHERVQEMVKDIAPKVPGLFFEYGRRMVKIRHRRAALQVR